MAAWCSYIRVMAVMACDYGDCDALWSIWPILFFCGVPFVAYAAVQANMWKSDEILKKDSHMQILYGDAIKGNFAETLGHKYPHPLYHLSVYFIPAPPLAGKNALVLTEVHTDRKHAIALVEHLKNSHRNAEMGLQLELDLFKVS